MITIEPTTDEQYIKSVLLSPEIYANMSDDACPAEPSLLQGVDIKSIPGFFLRVLVDGVASGLFWLIWREKSVEAHTALLPNCRGRSAMVATRRAMEWVFKNTQAFSITSYAWSDCPAVKMFCYAVGMTPTVTAPWPATRSGHPVRITYFETTREAFI